MINTFSVKDVCVYYGQNLVIDRLSFSVQGGDILSIMGPNGGGKTTLLSTLVGLHKGFKGSFGWQRPTQPHLAPLRPCEWAYMPQKFEVDRTFPLNVRQVVAMGDDKASKDKVDEALENVGLLAQASSPLAHLSLGQFQRMFFARIIVQETSLVILDEPFAGVDEKNIEDLMQIIFHWRDQGKIILLAQHNRARALKHFPLSLLLARNFYKWGKTHEVLEASQWAAAHEMAHPPQCC